MKRKTSEDASSAADRSAASEAPQAEELGEQLLELMLEAQGGRAQGERAQGERAVLSKERLDGVLMGRLERFTLDDGKPVVSFGGCTSPDGIVARATATLEREDVGQDVALMFEDGDPSRPIVMGRLRISADNSAVGNSAVHVEVDGERTVVSGEREIVLRCGEASITLTRAGKVFIRGEYVLTRSSGVNRIQGGSVQIN